MDCSPLYLRFNEYMNYIINFRVSDIERWRKQLEKTLNEVNAEIGVLQEAKESCERAFEAKALPHDVTTGCKRNSIPKSTFFHSDLGLSLDSKLADKELKAMTSEKSKSCVTTFTKKLVITFQLSRTRSGHISLK